MAHNSRFFNFSCQTTNLKIPLSDVVTRGFDVLVNPKGDQLKILMGTGILPLTIPEALRGEICHDHIGSVHRRYGF